MNLYKKVEYLLYNYKTMKAEIKNIDLEIEQLEYIGCAGISYEEKSAPTNQFSSSVENEVISREKRIAVLNQSKKETSIKISKIDNALEVLDTRQHNIITMTYFDKLSYREISTRIDLTEDYIGDLKRDIIGKISGLIYF